MLKIHRAELQRLHAHALEGFPHEVVGILAGDRASGHISRVCPLINERADSAHNRYRVSGLVMMKAEQQVETQGLEIVGYYHSHPDHPAQYSDYDRDHALPNMSYLITAIHGGEDGPFVADTLSWRLRDDRSCMDEEPIDILD